jgi:hypothetical protein
VSSGGARRNVATPPTATRRRCRAADQGSIDRGGRRASAQLHEGAGQQRARASERAFESQAESQVVAVSPMYVRVRQRSSECGSLGRELPAPGKGVAVESVTQTPSPTAAARLRGSTRSIRAVPLSSWIVSPVRWKPWAAPSSGSVTLGTEEAVESGVLPTQGREGRVRPRSLAITSPIRLCPKDWRHEARTTGPLRTASDQRC